MKSLFLIFSLVLGSATTAIAKDIQLKGAKARDMMESLAASRFEVSNIDEEWSGKTLKISTGPITCRYNVAYFPDEWMSSVSCVKSPTGQVLANPMGLAKAIEKYADKDAGLGNRWLDVTGVDCTLEYDSKTYSCLVMNSQ